MKAHCLNTYTYTRPSQFLCCHSSRLSATNGHTPLGKQEVKLISGVPVEGPDLSTTVSGLKLPNPFIIASGPPGTNYSVMKKAFDEGWGAVVSKTVCLDWEEMQNVTPRYSKLRSSRDREVMGWENIELISDRPLDLMLEELTRLKDEYPDRVLIASISEKPNRAAWEELIEKVEATGVDGLEINFSCPHGLPEKEMGMSIGQDPAKLREVCGWIKNKTKLPFWAKMTPNITEVTVPARASLEGGASGVSAINTITCVTSVDLDTLRPQPCVEGYSTTGGYSFKAVKPIALAHVQKCAKMIQEEFKGKRSLSGIGGVERSTDAAEFILLGADTVQVCTGVMIHGYSLIRKLCGGLQEFMGRHEFSSIDDFRGASLPYMISHRELVQKQSEARLQRKIKRIIKSDADWTGDKFSKEVESMVSD